MAETPASLNKQEVPKSFGVLKPVGHVVVGFADHQDREDARADLRQRGFADADIVAFDAVEMKAQLDSQLGQASGAAGFGYEIVLANFYRELAAVGHEWLIVRAGNDGLSQQVADVARKHHAELADRYGTLVVEQMLTPTNPGAPH
jgi:hypothetical protein